MLLDRLQRESFSLVVQNLHTARFLVNDVTLVAETTRRNNGGTTNPEEEPSPSSAPKNASSHLCERAAKKPKREIRSAGDRIHPWLHLLVQGCQLQSQTCRCGRLPAPPCYTPRARTDGDDRDLGCASSAPSTNAKAQTQHKANITPLDHSDTKRSHLELPLGFLPPSVTTRVAIVQRLLLFALIRDKA